MHTWKPNLPWPALVRLSARRARASCRPSCLTQLDLARATAQDAGNHLAVQSGSGQVHAATGQNPVPSTRAA